MSKPPQATPVIRAPIEVYSVHFDFSGGHAIRLRDPVTNQLLGATPEWVAGMRDELSAYVRGTRPKLSVVFKGAPTSDGMYTVGAIGVPFSVAEQPVVLTFDPSSGLSASIVFQAMDALPDRVGLHASTLDWYVRQQHTPSLCTAVGTSTHRIATSWRTPPPPPAGEAGMPAWIYRPLMEWTCQWAVGLDDEFAICNAIITNVANSGLRYGVYAADVREMLLNGGGMCGVWYEAFQQMAHCQGVFVYRRRFLVDWRVMANGEEHWCAIVICAGGLNQTAPTHPPSDFHDNHAGFPIPAGLTVPLVTVNERRYRFWGAPGHYLDGHCINFLEYNGGLYLFDACFGVGPIQVHAPLPPNSLQVAHGGASLAPFRAAYLDKAIDYMLGSICNGPHLMRSIFLYPPGIAVANGMTVPTADIPEVVNGNNGLTFRWGD